MEANFIERLQEYMQFKGINDNQMTVAAELSVGLLGKLKKNGKGMNSSNIEKILSYYTDLSAEWLLTGRGSMLHEDACTTESPSKSSGMEDKLLNIIQAQAEEIGQLRERINQLERVKNASTANTEHTANVG